MKRSLVMSAAVAGLLAPIWFTTLVVLQGVLNPDYSHVAMPISALAALDSGWIQNLNFYVFSALTFVLYIALHFAVKPSRYGSVGTTLLLLSSAGDGVRAKPEGVNLSAVTWSVVAQQQA